MHTDLRSKHLWVGALVCALILTSSSGARAAPAPASSPPTASAPAAQTGAALTFAGAQLYGSSLLIGAFRDADAVIDGMRDYVIDTLGYRLVAAASLASDPLCQGVADDMQRLKDLVRAIRNGQHGDAAHQLAAIQRQLLCLPTPSLRAFDQIVARSIEHGLDNLPSVERDVLLRALAPAALLVLDQLMYSGRAQVQRVLTTHAQSLSSVLAGYPHQALGVWLFHFGRGALVQLPGRRCSSSAASSCVNTMQFLVGNVLGNPRNLGTGACSLAHLLKRGGRCLAGITCQSMLGGASSGGPSGTFGALSGGGAGSPSGGLTAGASPFGATSGSGLLHGPGLAASGLPTGQRFGIDIGDAEAWLCGQGNLPGPESGAAAAFGGFSPDAMFDCLLARARANDASVQCAERAADIGGSAPPAPFGGVTIDFGGPGAGGVWDPRCQTNPLASGPSAGGEPPQAELPKLDEASDKEKRDAINRIKDAAKDPKFLERVNAELKKIGKSPITQSQLDAIIDDVGKERVAVGGPLPKPTSKDGVVHGAAGPVKDSARIEGGLSGAGKSEAIAGELGHRVLFEAGLDAALDDGTGKPQDNHHPILTAFGIHPPHGKRLRSDLGPENDHCSNAARRAQAFVDCVQGLAEKAGLGAKPGIEPGQPIREDPRTILPTQDSDFGITSDQCLDGLGGATVHAQLPSGCEVMLCIDPSNCRCGSLGGSGTAGGKELVPRGAFSIDCPPDHERVGTECVPIGGIGGDGGGFDPLGGGGGGDPLDPSRP